MEQAWIIMGETYLLTIVISLFVAFLIHMMTLLIRRFGTAANRADLQILTDFRRTGSRSDVFSDCQNRN